MFQSKNLLFIFLLGFGFLVPLKSQKLNSKILSKNRLQKKYCDARKCEAFDALNFATGIGPSGNILPFGSIDPEWKVVNKPPVSNNNYHNSISIPKAFVIKPYQQNWNVLPGAGILSPASVPTFSSNNKFSSQPWRVRRTFCVCEKSRITFKGQIKADDKGALVLYNGNHVEIFRITTPNTHGFNNPTPFSEVHTLPGGNYYFEFELLNTHAVATGFSVSGNMNTNGKVLINGSSRCCPNASITIQKIIEDKASCNGKLDGNDKPGQGWNFTLLNNKGQIVKTGTTNSNGEVSFSGLTQGTYTVKETSMNGYYPKAPSSGSMKFNVKSNGVYFTTFYNCIGNDSNNDPEIKPCCPPISKNDLSTMLFISGNMSSYRPSFKLSSEFKKRIQAYANYAMSLDHCLDHVTVEYVIRKPYALPDNFNLASNTILSRGATVFKKNQSITTWGQSTLSNINLQGNKWYRLEIVLYGGPDSCARWNFPKGCEFPKLNFNLMSAGKSNSRSFSGSIREVGGTIK